MFFAEPFVPWDAQRLVGQPYCPSRKFTCLNGLEPNRLLIWWENYEFVLNLVHFYWLRGKGIGFNLTHPYIIRFLDSLIGWDPLFLLLKFINLFHYLGIVNLGVWWDFGPLVKWVLEMLFIQNCSKKGFTFFMWDFALSIIIIVVHDSFCSIKYLKIPKLKVVLRKNNTILHKSVQFRSFWLFESTFDKKFTKRFVRRSKKMSINV